jgi:hypothetical protein
MADPGWPALVPNRIPDLLAQNRLSREGNPFVETDFVSTLRRHRFLALPPRAKGRAVLPPKALVGVHAGFRFGALQVQRNSLTVDEHDAAIDQFLAGRIVFLVTQQRCKRNKELH